MKCLIIAAGKGERLKSKHVPKPLLPVAGLKLIERTIVTANRAGIDDFYIVTGNRENEVDNFLEDIATRRKIKITHIHNENWDQAENGLSVLVAKDYIKENFVLLMSDHIFQEETLKGLIQNGLNGNKLVLAIDTRVKNNPYIEIDDVTKVKYKNGKIENIGKHIDNYNAYDTGMFLCSPYFFSILEKSMQKGKTSLSAGVKTLAEEGSAGVFDIGDRFWMDIDTPADLKKAEKLLYSRLAKPHDGWISKRINRKFSTRIFTPFFLKFFPSISPNMVSIISALTGILGAILFFFHKGFWGGIVTQLASILDGSDGEIARLKKMESPFGNFFDALLDRYTDFFILSGIGFYLLIDPLMKNLLGVLFLPVILFFSLSAVIGHIMVSYTSARALADFGYKYKGKWYAAGRGRDIRLFMVFIGGILSPIHPIFLLLTVAIIGLLTNAIVLKRIIVSYNLVTQGKIKPASTEYTSKFSLPDAVIFDLDGTIADTMGELINLATNMIASNYNISTQEARKGYLETTGLDFATQLEIMFPGDKRNKRVAEEFEERKKSLILGNPIFPDALDALKYFKDKGVKVFVCSSTTDEMIKEYFKRHQMDGLIYSFSGLKKGFSKANQIKNILENNQYRKDKVIFVGDSLKDGEIAKNLGIKFYGVERMFSGSDFSNRGLESVGDLKEFVGLFN